MSDTNRSLVESASRGDVGAIEDLLQQYLPALKEFVRQKAGAHLLAREQSSDLVQSTCREVLEHMHGFKYQGEKAFKNWLFTMALRKVIGRARYYRAEKRDIGREVTPRAGTPSSTSGPDPQEAESLLTPSRFAMARESQGKLDRAFEQLGPDYRAVIVMARVAGLSHAEIAQRMNRSEGAVRVLLSRALARLATLAEQEAESDPSVVSKKAPKNPQQQTTTIRPNR